MLKRMLAMALTVGVAVGMLTSCGGSSSKPTPTPGKGALITLIGDAPLCDVVSLHATITGLTLTPVGSTSQVAVFVTSASLAPSINVNLALMRDSSTVLNLASVVEGTYDKATLTFSTTQIAAYDPTQNPPVRTLAATLTNAKPTFTIDPPLTITKDGVSMLRMEFDMVRSLEVDAQGQVNGTVTPVLRAVPLVASGSQGFGELDGLQGFVRTVTPTSASAGFIGSFLLQLLSSSLSLAPAVNVSITSNQSLVGVSALNQLLTGSFVDLDGYFDSKGNLVANGVESVEVEDVEETSQNKVALIGRVVSLTKDASGNVTQFNLWVQEEEPDMTSSLAVDSVVQVNVSSSTTFQYASRSANFAFLPFDATTLAVGQEVVVHGPFTKTTGQPTTVAADKVYLKLQAFQGSFAPPFPVPPGSDDKTGAFQLAPCCTLLQGAPIYVLTNNQTAFVNLSGLSALSPQATLLVRGLPFFQLQGGTIYGVPVPAGTLVMLAKQVHQLQ